MRKNVSIIYKLLFITILLFFFCLSAKKIKRKKNKPAWRYFVYFSLKKKLLCWEHSISHATSRVIVWGIGPLSLPNFPFNDWFQPWWVQTNQNWCYAARVKFFFQTKVYEITSRWLIFFSFYFFFIPQLFLYFLYLLYLLLYISYIPIFPIFFLFLKLWP